MIYNFQLWIKQVYTFNYLVPSCPTKTSIDMEGAADIRYLSIQSKRTIYFTDIDEQLMLRQNPICHLSMATRQFMRRKRQKSEISL